MKKLTLLFCFCCATLILLAQELDYPISKRVKQLDEYHGQWISDPYRWLENTTSLETTKWMKAQDEVLKSFVRNAPERALIHHWIEKLGKTGTRYSVPIEAGGNYYYNSFSPQANQAVLHWQAGLNRERKILLDFNKKFAGTIRQFGGFSISNDGKQLVYNTREGQVRWGHLRVFNIASQKDYPEVLEGINSSTVFWNKDNSGFYYISYGDTEALNAKSTRPIPQIKYHQLGKNPKEDILVYAQTDSPNTLYGIAISSDFQYLIIHSYEGRSDRNKVLLAEINNNYKIHQLIDNEEHAFSFIGNKTNKYFFYSNQKAPNGKVIVIDIDSKVQHTIIPNDKATLAGGSSAGGNGMNLIDERLVLLYREGTASEIRVYDLQGKIKQKYPLETGWIGSGIVGNPKGKEAWFTLNTFVEPTSTYRIDLVTGKLEMHNAQKLPINKADYVTKNTFYTSKDGTKVPIFVAYKKGLKKDGKNPVFMYGYGFGGWVAVPWYQAHMMTWLEMGGIYVLPGVRGGGEFGDAWRDAGLRLNRQNAIDDYIAAAQWLIEQKYTAPGKIVANGWSASGSLAAAACMQRPELFGAGLIGIPSLDLLRYNEFTAFSGWTRSYGSPEIKEEFFALRDWSPYHNIKTMQCYPPMLVTVGEKDPTTPPQHGYKFVAAMQNQGNCGHPMLLKIVWGEGHGFGTTSEQSRETYADELTYLVKVLGLDIMGKLKM